MKYCVYVHQDLQGDIFYIGSGTFLRAKTLLKRPTKRPDRGINYNRKVEELNFNYTYKIVFDKLTKQDARTLEKILFKALSLTCVLTNKNIPTSTKGLAFEFFNDLFYYDELSPSGLRWKNNIYCGKNNNIKVVNANDVAGTINNAGYYVVNHKAKLYLAHRIVYLLLNNQIDDDLVIDHIDRNKLNNKIENLRQVLQRTNMLNSSRITNKTGVQGVCYDIKKDSYRAYINTADGKQISKRFSCKIYGKDAAFALAKKSRQELYTLHCS